MIYNNANLLAFNLYIKVETFKMIDGCEDNRTVKASNTLPKQNKKLP